ncbi:hypothetical protein [Piscirickettsia salmonis]|uniref:Uncharacterized protein n=1 Tax=Piscirickettsia salmonis TaxID=1238 RepID=A0A9Q6PRW9_PISSA|nr:hypothetical protein [Piscirickettsia salmonis]ALA26061.1 phage protein [Piscirickettsia salmonis]QGN76323.1 hypothetical protein Psal001_00504 [Piscirickettsia salmonis]QGN79884.1 hypothetical protein Psal002_00500 [Piscirickettsia salmonis]QGN83474.1 hypothetical protein Psal003_00500 [Piscirickettsia salmonis]QGN86987.1 hypothetical protein Psal004_00499 [Piscirickettsia salmonis]
MSTPKHPSYKSNMTPVVAAIGEMHFAGLTLPETWFNVITTVNAKPDIDAILILAEIISWYRPIESRCPDSGRLIGYKRRFPLHKLQRSYKELGDKFAISSKRTADAISRLVAMGLITLEVQVEGIKNKQVERLFFEPVPSTIHHISCHTQTMPEYIYRTPKSAEELDLKAPKPQKKASSIAFDTFWEAYPDGFRDSRSTMFNLWQRRGLESDSEHIIRDVLTRKAKDANWADHIIPRMQTYINQRRWEADIAPIIPQNSFNNRITPRVTNPLSQSYYHEQQQMAGLTETAHNKEPFKKPYLNNASENGDNHDGELYEPGIDYEEK